MMTFIKAFAKRLKKEAKELGMTLRVRGVKKQVNGKTLSDTKDYRQYVSDQIERSYRQAELHKDKHAIPARTIHLVELFRSKVKPTAGQKILCIGCRYGAELDYLESTAGLQATGLDLFSVDPRIVIGDMHKIPFEENTFDYVYSCHSLEHSFDVEKALQEFVRVCKNGGHLIIEVPIHFQPSKTDLHDLGGVNELVKLLSTSVAAVVVGQDDANAGNDKKQVSRLIAQIKK
jgi:SAM-dependent methyltransferase